MIHAINKILGFLGSGICHQKAIVTFEYNKVYMPVCSRCTGIYIGFVFSLLAIILFDRKIKSEIPSIKIFILLIFTFLPMGADVALTTFKIIEANNYVRFITGFLVGWILTLVILPLKNSVMLKKAVVKSYLDNKIKFILWLFVGIIIISLFIFSYKQLFLFWSILSILGLIVFILYIISILFFAISKKFSNSIFTLKRYFLYSIIGFILSIGMLTLLASVRRFLISFL
ncbi:MAG: DUF2085 domain-containing protein [Actinobacteria bacterium]|nr:DUF2085 domain-containing protein [Actinomycetota bacterium]